MIQEATLIEAILGFRAQIDFLWQFFVTVHIAIFALLFIYDEAVESLNIIARIFAIAGVALFEWINGKALANTYLLLDATLDQYRTLYGQADRFQPDFFRYFVSMSFADRPATVLVTHSMAFVVIYIGVIYWRSCRVNSCRPQEGPRGRGRLSCVGGQPIRAWASPPDRGIGDNRRRNFGAIG